MDPQKSFCGLLGVHGPPVGNHCTILSLLIFASYLHCMPNRLTVFGFIFYFCYKGVILLIVASFQVWYGLHIFCHHFAHAMMIFKLIFNTCLESFCCANAAVRYF